MTVAFQAWMIVSFNITETVTTENCIMPSVNNFKKLMTKPLGSESKFDLPVVKRQCVTLPPLFTLQPGEHEILLCIDNAETCGG